VSGSGELRAVVFGAGGLLGQELVANIPGSGIVLAGAPRGRGEADITDDRAVGALLERVKANLIFNAAAYTDVDGSEDNQAAAHAANAEGPEVLARVAARLGARLVHYSTDFVFDGEQETPYDEEAAPGPASVYARTKLEGERRVLGTLKQSAVLRVGCLYGRHGRNFPSTLLRRLRAGEVIRADNERRVSPTWARPVARLSLQVAASGQAGIFHATAQGETSWADFARALAGWANIADPKVEGVPISTLKLRAVRPRRAVLVSRRLPLVGLQPLPSWQDQAQAYLASEGAETPKI
jgi:dTDP-4-dehydrorhamnose reductase